MEKTPEFTSAEDIDSYETEEYKDAALLAQSPVEYMRKKLTGYGIVKEMVEDECVSILKKIHEDLQADLNCIKEHATLANCDEDVNYLKEHNLMEYESWRVVLRWFIDAGVTSEALTAFITSHTADGRKSEAMRTRVLLGILHQELDKIEEINVAKRYREVQDFSADPVKYLMALREEFAGAMVAAETIDRMNDYASALLGEPIETKNAYLKVWLTHDLESTESIAALFTLMKQSGFTLSEMLTWIALLEEEADELEGDEKVSAAEKMVIKKMRVILETIYNEA